MILIGDEVRSALDEGRPVVALETTLVSHGFPHPDGVMVAAASEDAVRASGAVPATVGVVDGSIHVGLARDDLGRFGESADQVRKCGPRDLAPCLAQGALGATTVGATVTVCRRAGIPVMATGGLGGVHQEFPAPPDVSADLPALAACPVIAVSAGVKSLLDVDATAEMLETLGVPLLGWRTDTLPLFYARGGGPPVSARVELPAEVAQVARLHWDLGGGAVLLVRPPDRSLDDIATLTDEAVARVRDAGVTGPAVTPEVLRALSEATGGRTTEVNRELIVANAALAGEVAVALAAGASAD